MLTQNNTLIIGGLIWMSIASIVFYEVLNFRRALNIPSLSPPSLETKILHNASPLHLRETVLTKEALDELVEQAAKHQLLKKAFGQSLSYTKLPPSKKTFGLKKLMPESEISKLATHQMQIKINPQRCQYKDQTYVPGDTINTDHGWVRCVSIVLFDVDSSNLKNALQPVWIEIK